MKGGKVCVCSGFSLWSRKETSFLSPPSNNCSLIGFFLPALQIDEDNKPWKKNNKINNQVGRCMCKGLEMLGCLVYLSYARHAAVSLIAILNLPLHDSSCWCYGSVFDTSGRQRQKEQVWKGSEVHMIGLSFQLQTKIPINIYAFQQKKWW